MTGLRLTDLNAVYTRLEGVAHQGHPVYSRESVTYKTPAYLHYWAADKDWKLGSNYTTGASWANSKNNGDAAEPHLTSTWFEYDTTKNQWASTGAVAASCTSVTAPPSEGATELGCRGNFTHKHTHTHTHTHAHARARAVLISPQ